MTIVANWKMNPRTLKEAERLASSALVPKGVHAVFCPPFPYIAAVKERGLVVGAQDCFFEEKGAFTGRVGPSQLYDLGCTHVILGHSELGEDAATVNKKVKAALKAGLTAVVCAGERAKGEGVGRALGELKAKLAGVRDLSAVLAAYEPVWAIGSQAASPSWAGDVIEKIKDELPGLPVLYGGSVDSSNVRDFIDAGADGALVGGASLDAREFSRILSAVVA